MEANAQAAREQAEREAVAAQWQAEVEQAMAEGEWSVAKKAVGRWLKITPESEAAQAARRRIEGQEAREKEARSKKQEEEEEARKAREAQEREAARVADEEAHRQAQAEAERKAQVEATAQVLKAQLDGLYGRIKTAAAQQDWPEVLQLAGQIQALQPGDSTAIQWSAHAREQLHRPVVPVLLTRKSFEPELILISAGEFLMGSDPQKDPQALGYEQPQHTLYLPDYYIAKAPTTNTQYVAFVQVTGYKAPQHWKEGKPPQGKDDHPVVNVSWYDAMAYCKWLTEVTGKPYTLPSEAEWEKAARGPDGRIYPWGNEPPDKTRANFAQSMVGGLGRVIFGVGSNTTPVGKYSPRGDSPYGCIDMAGNVSEWTRSLSESNWNAREFKYPYRADDRREDLQEAGFRMTRGGAWYLTAIFTRCTHRVRSSPETPVNYLGFRCVIVRAQN